MPFEVLLKHNLTLIQELNDNIFPLSVPESVNQPYVSYCLAGGDYLETLDGSEPIRLDYEVNILASKHSVIKDLEKKVETILFGLKGQKAYEGTVRQVLLDMPVEQYEEATDLQRATIAFKIYF